MHQIDEYYTLRPKQIKDNKLGNRKIMKLKTKLL